MVRIKKLFSLSMLFSLITISSLCAMELSPESIRGNHVGPIGLSYDEEGFIVTENDLSTRVHSYDTDSLFRGKSKKQIAAFAAMGKFKVSKFDNGEYAVRAHGDLKGGGPVTAWTFYCLTKIGIYGALAGAVAGSAVAIVATGGGAAPAVAVGVNAGAGVLGTAVGAAAGVGTATSLGVGGVAAAVGGSAAATTTVATVASGAMAGGATVGTVETLATMAFIAGMAMPTP